MGDWNGGPEELEVVEQLAEHLQLSFRRIGILVVRRCEVTHHTLQMQRTGPNGPEQFTHFLGRQAETPHAGIDLEVDGERRGSLVDGRRQGAHRVERWQHGRQMVFEQVGEFFRKDAAHD